MKTNILADFQICIRVPLTSSADVFVNWYCYVIFMRVAEQTCEDHNGFLMRENWGLQLC